jgi:hypothetical protein
MICDLERLAHHPSAIIGQNPITYACYVPMILRPTDERNKYLNSLIE